MPPAMPNTPEMKELMTIVKAIRASESGVIAGKQLHFSACKRNDSHAWRTAWAAWLAALRVRRAAAGPSRDNADLRRPLSRDQSPGRAARCRGVSTRGTQSGRGQHRRRRGSADRARATTSPESQHVLTEV